MAGQTRIDGNLIDTGTDPNDIVSVSVGDTRYPRLSQDNTLAGNLTVDGDLNLVATGAGTGVFTIAAPDSNTNRTLTLPDEAGTVLTDVGVPSSAMPAGSVIQVVSTTKTDESSTTSDSYVVIPDLTIDILPLAASSKMVVFFSVPVSANVNDNASVIVAPFRDGTNLLVPDSTDSRRTTIVNHNSFNSRIDEESMVPASGHILDTPNTTSTITYDVRFAVTTDQSGATIFVNRSVSNLDNVRRVKGVATITVMEIAG